MFAALLLGQALAYGAPYYPDECDCPPPAYEQAHEEVRLNSDFFIGEGGVGPAYAAPIYSGGGFVVFDGSDFGGGRSFARAGAGAFASASASASASARVSVRATGGFRHGGRHHGGHKGGH